MGNRLYDELIDQLSDIQIIGPGIVKKAVKNIGANEDTLTKAEVERALDEHIESALRMFLGQKGAKERVKRIRNELKLS